MITKQQVEEVVGGAIAGSNLFLVDLSVSPSNRITVLVDGDNGLTIDQCVAISRAVEAAFNRDVEDYELEVSSPGVGQPLKIARQYMKNIGREVEVLQRSGVKVKGILRSATDSNFTIEVQKRVLKEGEKRKKLVVEPETFDYTDIKSTKVLVSFDR